MDFDSHKEPEPPRLLRTPAPYPDESLMGYVLRLTEENGYDAPKWIFDLAGLDINVAAGGWPVLYDPHSDLRSLERVLGLEGGEFTGAKYRLCDAGGPLVAYGSTLSKRLVRFRSPKLCPACLEQANYHRAFWDLLPFTACPVHGLMLIDKCSRCGKHVHWLRGRVSYCRCGADLRGAPTVIASPSTLDVSARIHQLCEYPPVGRASGAEQRNPLFELDFGDFCDVLTLLADNHLSIRRGRGLTTLTDNFSSHEAYACAFRAFINWPKNFYEHLDEIKCLRGRGILNSTLFHEIHNQFKKRDLHFAVIAVEDYVEKNEWKDFPSRGTPPPIFRRFISKVEACRRLQVNENRLDALIENEKLRVAYRWRGSEALVDGLSIEEMLNQLNGLLPMWSAAKAIGVEPHDIEDLVRHGCLKAASGPEADGLPEWRFKESNLYSLINAIADWIIEPSAGPQEELIGADEAITLLRSLGVSIGRFTQDMLRGKLAPAGKRKLPGLPGFLFRKVDVLGYLDRLGAKKGRAHRRQSNVPEYKLWARALVVIMEKNSSVSLRRHRGGKDVLDEGAMDVRDLAYIGRQLFSRSPHTTLELNETK